MMGENVLKSRSLLDSIPVALLFTDIHSRILYTNQFTEHLFGHAKDEVAGKRIRLLFLEEDLIYLLPNVIYLTLYQNGFEGEALLRQKDGTRVFVHLSTTSFKERGETFLIFSFQEIQRLKELERERSEMEHWANLGMMVEGIAHQVRNPIVSIGGYTQRLHKSYPPSVKNKFYLDQILRETKKLEMMIQRMEEYILIPKPTFRKENFREVIENTIRSFSKEAMKKKISLHLETGTLEGNGSLFIDKDLMINALSQILKNSIETITQIPERKKETPIKVTLSGDKESVGVSISDQGEGISKKDLGHIFNPFFSTRPDRVGLGLTFAKRVVEQHRGRIRVESRLKRGTVVTVTLPRDRRKRIRRELIFPETDLFISF